MKEVTILIKPASGKCNMRCGYCFYQDEVENREYRDYGIMSEETARALIDRTFDTFDEATFAFQGGEPTVRGLEFFRFFSEYARARNENAHFSIQTNGYALDRKWCDLFKEYSYLVGLSMDGNKAIHDRYRRNINGEGTFKRVFTSLQLLKSFDIDFNILITLTKDAALKGKEIYQFLKRNGARYQQYIPCVDPMEKERGAEDYSLTPDSFLKFLKEVFILYYRDWEKGDYVSIRYFDNLVNMLLGLKSEYCGLLGFCPDNYVIEADGSVFPCDFYVLDDYLLGNMNTDSFASFDRRREEIGFRKKSLEVDEKCKSCSSFLLCRGGCRRDREDFSTGKLNLSYLCPAYREFIPFAMPYLRIMAEAEGRARRMGL